MTNDTIDSNDPFLVPALPEQVHGDDERQPVADTHIAPFHSICAINRLKSGSSMRLGLGTGWLLSPNYVATAAHVVTRKTQSSSAVDLIYPADSFEVIFNLSPENTSSEIVKVECIKVFPPYKDSIKPQFDFALLKLKDSIPSTRKPFQLVDENKLKVGDKALIAGYAENKSDGKQMVFQEKTIERIDDRLLRHTIDTSEGQSGAPMLVHDSAGSYTLAAGLQVKGFDHEALNRACAIEAMIKEWCASVLVLPA